MTFIAHYITINTVPLPEYYRTITADSEPQANKIAKAYARKGYRLLTLTQKD